MYKILMLLFINLFCSLAFAEDITQNKVMNDCGSIIKTLKPVHVLLKEKFKKKYDINIEYDKILKINNERPDCQIWKKLQVNDKLLKSYEKSIFSPDKSFEIKEDKCSTVEISTKNMPKNNNQGDFRWCFAWSATDLMSFNEEVALSVYDTGSQVHLFGDDRKIELAKNANTNFSQTAGTTTDAIQVLIDGKGICTEEQTNLAKSEWLTSNKIIADLISPNTSFREVLCKYESFNIDKIKNLSSNILNILDKLTSDKKLGAFLDLQCSERHQIKKKYEIHDTVISKEYKTTPTDLMRDLDNALGVDHQPVSAGFAGDILYHGQNFIGSPDHYSTIIGRKYNKVTSQCEYLIKNSWGDECIKDKAPTINCVDGNYWVPRTLLQKNIEDISWLTPK